MAKLGFFILPCHYFSPDCDVEINGGSSTSNWAEIRILQAKVFGGDACKVDGLSQSWEFCVSMLPHLHYCFISFHSCLFRSMVPMFMLFGISPSTLSPCYQLITTANFSHTKFKLTTKIKDQYLF